MVTLPYTISNADQPDATAIQGNDAALASGLNQIGNGNISQGAGIELGKLANPFSVHEQVFDLLAVNQGADFSTLTNFGPFATSFTDLLTFRKRVPAGQLLFLIAVEFFIAAASATPAIEAQLLVDGTVVGQALPLTGGSYHTIVNSTVFSAPLQPIPDQAVFKAQIRQDAAGSGTARGLTMRLTFKQEHVS